MAEILLVLLALLAVGAVGVLTSVLTPKLMAEAGLWTLTAGLATGLPTGLWYHVVLYRLLARRMRLPDRWWISPSNLHRHLTQEEIARITPWFLLGGIGFLLCLAGGLAAMAGLVMAAAP